jgi:tRNA A37 N6-isopentenylltransferase MiaA
LAPDIEARAQEINRMVRRVAEAEEVFRHWKRQMSETETERASTQSSLMRATERWEQIQRQIGTLGANP